MGIVQSMMEIIEQQAEAHNVSKVRKISLEFGRLTGVMPEAITFAFDVLAEGTVAAGAEIEITIIPVKVFCLDCSKEFTLDDYSPFCPECESAALHIIQGRDEMKIASMEVEDETP